MPEQEGAGYTAPGEERLAGIEPYWWAIVCFIALTAVVLIMTQVVY